MQRTLALVGGVLVALLITLVVAVQLQPDTTHVERSLVVNASPAEIYPLVSDLRRTLEWSPWDDRDPEQTVAFSENPSGVGAWYTWDGNDDVGKGRQEIVEVTPNQRVVTTLEFVEPFESRATSTVTLVPEGPQTRVIWAFDSQNDFAAKAVSLFMSMDEALGPDFEQGLANLKPLAEAEAEARRQALAATQAAELAGATEDAEVVED